MNMDFSHLHMYSPPQCAPDNTGYTYSLSSSYSIAALEFEQEHKIAPVYESPKMSRRSLRLQTGRHGNESLADSVQNHSSSYTTRETRVLRNKKLTANSRTLSLDESATPKKSWSFLAASTPIGSSNSQEGLTQSEAVHLSSTPGRSSQRHRTITTTTTTTTAADRHWGHHASHSLPGHNTSHSLSRVNGEAAKSNTMFPNGYICRDCTLNSQTADSHFTQSASSLLSDTQMASSLAPFTRIYTRDRSQKNKTGVLASVSSSCIHYSKQALIPIAYLVTTFFNSVVWLGSRAKNSTGVVGSFSDSMRHAASSGWSHLRQNTLDRVMGNKANGYEGRAHSSYCGSMNVKHLVKKNASHLKLNGSLCDDCKGKNYSETHTVLPPKSSRLQRLGGALWSTLVYAGHFLLLPGHCIASAVTTVTQKLLSVLWMLFTAPVNTVRGLLWLLGRGWYLLVYVMSALNVFFLTCCLPKLGKLLGHLFPIFLLVALWLWGPSTTALLAYLPTINLTEWRPASPITYLSNLMPVLATVPASPPVAPLKPTPASPVSQPPPILPAVNAVDLEHLKLLELQLTSLWERVQDSEQKQDGHHKNLLGLYVTLKEQLKTQTDRESLGLWVSSLLDQKLAVLRAEQHDARLAEVQKLELELNKIREDVKSVIGCKGKCEQLGTLQETVSAQVTSQMRKDLKALFFGSGGTGQDQGEVPESLVLWLSQRYVSSPDLQASLAALEMSILRTISMQLEQDRAQTLEQAEFRAKSLVQTVTGTVRHMSAAEGMSEEQVKLIVQNALRLYSQDRTGLVDYALESAGGSILSTRCSETYETKTALMSLFGLPLWYFAQSPRVVIQPDVYPGHCWAFKGSQGYLVIRLTKRVTPKSFCMEHIPKALSPNGNITSAPRNFTVFGLDDEYQEEGKLLGHYMYQENGESLQMFPVQELNDKAFQIIEVRVLSNWGHPDYTCLYRFRVHGQPHPM